MGSVFNFCAGMLFAVATTGLVIAESASLETVQTFLGGLGTGAGVVLAVIFVREVFGV